MPLECTIICMDNPEYMRNGDFAPTRFEAQYDAVSMLITAKTNANPESTVGFLTMAGRNVEVVARKSRKYSWFFNECRQLMNKQSCYLLCMVCHFQVLAT